MPISKAERDEIMRLAEAWSDASFDVGEIDIFDLTFQSVMCADLCGKYALETFLDSITENENADAG